MDNPPQIDQLPSLLNEFQVDRACLERSFSVAVSPRRFERMQRFLTEWQLRTDKIAADTLTGSDTADLLLFRALLTAEKERIEFAIRRFAQVTASVLPFTETLIELEEHRRRFEDVDAKSAAKKLNSVIVAIDSLKAALEKGTLTVEPALAGQAAKAVSQLQAMLKTWFTFYNTYDPVFDWWVKKPYESLNSALTQYEVFLREKIAGRTGDAIVGEPIGREALIVELRYSQVGYTPEELIAAAEVEFEWCRTELRLAANDMGFGDDWRGAMEQVKSEHEEPGRQPALVRELALEAIQYVEEHDLVTVPPVAKECWRMEMMSAERQKTSPFFLGGETIIISFPTEEMSLVQKQMSLRGNNRAFSRATVHHELIPGHHLQLFSMQRYRPYRQIFRTPFWIEGWTLHWEMLLWERGFPRTPQERIGMLFWRTHRAARVIFSLRYHLGEMTAAECVEMLVTEACHERDNALAEVRRSFEGEYGALYQCAYLVGAWQMHALYREMVGSGKMTDREFHDRVMQENCIPIPTLRALITGQPLIESELTDWRFHPLPDSSGKYQSVV